MYVSHFSPWDDISMLRGAEPMLWDLADRPEFMHAIVRKLTDIALYKLDMAEKLGLIDPYQPLIHCTPRSGARAARRDEGRPRDPCKYMGSRHRTDIRQRQSRDA